MRSWKKPTPEQVDRAIALIARKEHYRYFFHKLENPEWLEPLWERGFFRNPPEPQVDEEQGIVISPHWPEADYLARIAKYKPETVCRIVQQIPSTSNVEVLRNLASATLNMPADIASQLLDKAREWATSSVPLDPLLADKLGELITHLTEGGELEAALKLAETLLDILPDPSIHDTEARSALEEFFGPSPEPRAKMDPWHYEQLLKKHLPELVRAAKLDALKLLCDLLDKALRLSQRRREDKTEDYSYIWYPAVEEHSSIIPRGDLKEVLADSIRDAAELLIREELVSLPEIVEHLRSRPWSIFHRIALHLLRQFPEKAPDLVTSHLMDRSKLGDLNLMHEYALLLRERFKVLTPDQRKNILDWIDQGPDLSWLGPDVSAEELEQRKKSWQLRRLTWIKDDLPEEWEKRYKQLVEEIGEPEHPEFPVQTGRVWTGPVSPKSAEELRKMSIDELVRFLKTWRPPKGIPARLEPIPEPEGLGRELTKVISENPERFASEATKFQGLDPTYVRALISGLYEAAKQGKAFKWEPILQLCRWVVKQPREIKGRSVREFGADPHWGWTRHAIAHLLSAGFGKDLIPIELRKAAWEVLCPITDDPDPTPEEEKRSALEPFELAINTTRGEALEAVFHYAVWVKKHLESVDNKERTARSLDEIPEVREMLEKHLDPENDPSIAIRSVYGKWFPWLVRIDEEWAREKAPKIFPLEESQRPLSEAAWQAYIGFNRPYPKVFQLLRDQYTLALERLSTTSEEGQRFTRTAREQLARHLMTLYWQGTIELDDPLLTRFWKKAPPDLRVLALQFIGHSLKVTEGEIEPSILERLNRLWESRLRHAKEEPENSKGEMAAFGWWFVSGKFEDGWAMQQLMEALLISKDVEADDLVMEQLVALADKMPLQCVHCVQAIAEGDREGFKIYTSRKRVRAILRTALHSSDHEAAREAERLINYLGSRGFFEFRDLLQER